MEQFRAWLMSFSLNVFDSMDLCLSGVRLCFSFYTFCLSTRKYLLSHQVQETETSTKSINTPGGSEVLITSTTITISAFCFLFFSRVVHFLATLKY